MTEREPHVARVAGRRADCRLGAGRPPRFDARRAGRHAPIVAHDACGREGDVGCDAGTGSPVPRLLQCTRSCLDNYRRTLTIPSSASARNESSGFVCSCLKDNERDAKDGVDRLGVHPKSIRHAHGRCHARVRCADRRAEAIHPVPRFPFVIL